VRSWCRRGIFDLVAGRKCHCASDSVGLAGSIVVELSVTVMACHSVACIHGPFSSPISLPLSPLRPALCVLSSAVPIHHADADALASAILRSVCWSLGCGDRSVRRLWRHRTTWRAARQRRDGVVYEAHSADSLTLSATITISDGCSTVPCKLKDTFHVVLCQSLYSLVLLSDVGNNLAVSKQVNSSPWTSSC